MWNQQKLDQTTNIDQQKLDQTTNIDQKSVKIQIKTQIEQKYTYQIKHNNCTILAVCG